MIEHLREHWWVYWGIGAAVALFAYRFSRSDGSKPFLQRARSLIDVYRYSDPSSKSYDPGFISRQLVIIVVGIPVVGLALLVTWWLGR